VFVAAGARFRVLGERPRRGPRDGGSPVLIRIKEAILQVVPPVVLRAWGYLRGDRPVAFKSVSRSWDDVRDEDPWSSAEWLELSRRKLENAQRARAAVAGGSSPTSVTGYMGVTALVVNRAGAQREQTRVLDFGGGNGVIYHWLREGLAEPDRVDWHVVDSGSELRAAGAKARRSGDRIHFHPSLDEIPDEVDVLHICTTLQYVRDWRGLLGTLLGKAPRFVVLTRTLAGLEPEFVARQSVEGHTCPCVFVNVDELIGLVSEAGYRLELLESGDSLAGRFARRFPPELRIPAELTLAFARS
jgi:putative methyltransferase (TIGR04325 family)